MSRRKRKKKSLKEMAKRFISKSMKSSICRSWLDRRKKKFVTTTCLKSSMRNCRWLWMRIMWRMIRRKSRIWMKILTGKITLEMNTQTRMSTTAKTKTTEEKATNPKKKNGT